MRKQLTFSDMEYSNRKRKTKREVFLESMNEIIPWSEWVSCIEPYYPKGNKGRPPRGIELMLRMYLLQIWFNLSDEGVEESIYDSYAMRQFMGLNFMEEQVPDATTLLHFRRLMEENKIGEKLFNAINYVLSKSGQVMRGGSIVDATLIEAPTSTKNEKKERDPEMHQVKKGNEWHFGMKAHIGVDAGSGYIHTVKATSGNISDINMTSELLREDDNFVYGDAGYLGIEKREEIKNNEHLSKVDWRINRRRGTIRALPAGLCKYWESEIERQKSSVRSKVEHPFRIIKGLFGYRKTAYRGIAKNLNRLFMLFGSANLLMCIWSGGLRKPVPIS